MTTDIAGIRVGHWTDRAAATGCTVVLFPPGTVASGEVRGGAPASREMDVLDPSRVVNRIDALLLTGGSAFGLAAADGVMRYCEERGMGVPTPAGPVPIVVALGLFDLAVGSSRVRPGPSAGYAACQASTTGPVQLGAVGAGTGATVGTLSTAPADRAGPDLVSGGGSVSGESVSGGGGGDRAGPGDGVPGDVAPGGGGGGVADAGGEPTPGPSSTGTARSRRRPGGLVGASAEAGELRVAALVAVNAFGAPGGDDRAAATATLGPASWAAGGRTSTTIGLVATNARLDKVGCLLVAQGAHDGLARAVFPTHTRFDGDAFVAAATGGVEADVDRVRALAVHVVARAVRSLAE